MNKNFFQQALSTDLSFLDKEITGVSTDTRTLKPGDLFVPLVGENFDGHSFIDEALSKGAVLALASSGVNHSKIIPVTETLKSLQKLGLAWQKKVNPKILAVTGSNGKTTTKVFASQILSAFFKTCASPKSFNNEVGVPLTQLALKAQDEVLLLEIGTNAPGEIQHLTHLAQPQVAMVTTVGASHLEGFHTVENVALEKQEIYKSDSVELGIFNLDNFFTLKMKESFKKQKLTFSSRDKNADCFLQGAQTQIDQLRVQGQAFGEEVNFIWKGFGLYNLYNLMSAFCFGKSIGLEVEQMVGLAPTLELPWGRSNIIKSKKGTQVLFDGYNANIQSFKSLYQSLRFLKQPLHFVFGEMLEQGQSTEEFHTELGRLAKELNPKTFTFVGCSFESVSKGYGKPLLKGEAKDIFGLAKQLKPKIQTGDVVVLKGSRGVQIEKFLEVL